MILLRAEGLTGARWDVWDEDGLLGVHTSLTREAGTSSVVSLSLRIPKEDMVAPQPVFNRSIYPREAVDEYRVNEFAQIMLEDGSMDRFPAIRVGRDTGWIYDGVHRFQAAEKAGVALKVELIGDPPGNIEALALGARLNEHGKPLNRSERRAIGKQFWEEYQRGIGFESKQDIARICGVSKQTVDRWFAEFEVEKQQAKHADPVQKTPQRLQAEQMLDRGEEIVAVTDQGAIFRGSYAPDTPRDKVEYQKVDGAVIDYASVRVEGQEIVDLLVDLRRLGRRIVWVKEAPIFHTMTLDDVALFSEVAQVLARAATAKKSGSATASL